ncbi:F-box domain-containing protein [Mycena kentingensis (nom. inval.)]|nr:F-box domain-containing protein [Mycena kentingensis (nom. inval.)]
MDPPQLSILPPLDVIIDRLRSNLPPPPELVTGYEATKAQAARALRRLQRDATSGSVIDLEPAEYHYAAYCALFAPIRRLPVEVLGEIFGHCARMAPPAVYGQQVDWSRIEKRTLRTLEGVCLRWSEIVRDSMSFWREIEMDGRAFRFLNSAQDQRACTLFAASLERARNVSLDVRLQWVHRNALPLIKPVLARCERLHIATIQTSQELTEFARCTKHNLPRLTFLRFVANDTAVESAEQLSWMDSEGAPRLRELSVSSSLMGYVPVDEMEELRTLECTAHLPGVPAAVAAAARIPAHIAYRFLFYPTNFDPRPGHHLTVADLTVHPTASDIHSLTLGVGNLHRPHAPQQATGVLQKTLAALTLPALQTLRFEKSDSSDAADTPLPVFWSGIHDAFLALAERSSFASDLLVLDLLGVNIPIRDLEECLLLLKVLEKLRVADIPSAHVAPLITGRLLWVRTDPLVPRLHFLTLHTTLAFDNLHLSEFVKSRAELLNSDSTDPNPSAFELHVRVLRGYWDYQAFRRWKAFRTAADVVALTESGKLRFSWTSLAE